MNKNLIYDLCKILKKYDDKDIAEVVSLLKDKRRLDEIINVLESMEKAAEYLGKAKIKRKPETKSSSFRGVSNAILGKGGEANPESSVSRSRHRTHVEQARE